MEWLEASLFTTNEGIEPVCAMLMEAGVDGMEIEDDIDMKKFLSSNNQHWDYVDDELLNKENAETCIKFYVSNNAFGNETLLAVRDGIKFIKTIDMEIDLGRLELSIKNVDDEDWLNNWKKYYKPLEIGKNIVIKPVWEEYPNTANKTIFSINPGHVFGTGLHQTTQLCIEQLEENVKPDYSILDLGCGTGILSVISLMIGASNATAIDIDANAVDIAYENAELNGVAREKYTVTSGNVLSDQGLQRKICNNSFDIVVANIVADVIIALSPLAPKCLKSGGIFISSGIISQRLDEVKAALTENDFDILEILSRDDWYCVVCRHA